MSNSASSSASAGLAEQNNEEQTVQISPLPKEAQKIPFYAFSSDRGCWEKCCSASSSSPPSSASALRVVTFNVLADCFPYAVRLAIKSEARFPALVKQLVELDATFCGLNEVTENSLELILADPFIRSNYFVTEIVPDRTAADRKPGNRSHRAKGTPGGLISPHGCVLLSKFPFVECFEVPPYLGGPRSAILGVVDLPNARGLLGVCSIHTIAFQSHENKIKREVQLKLATEMGHKLIDEMVAARANSGKDKAGFIIMGDMNLHFVNEDKNVIALDMCDAWAETHFGPGQDQDPGMTFNAKTNTMIPRYIPGEKRLMRLDRILISQGSKLGFASPCKIFGDSPVDSSASNKEVFLSDHYGLVVDLTVADAPLKRVPEVEALLKSNADLPNDDRNFSPLEFTLGLIPHAFWLAGRFTGAW